MSLEVMTMEEIDGVSGAGILGNCGVPLPPLCLPDPLRFNPYFEPLGDIDIGDIGAGLRY